MNELEQKLEKLKALYNDASDKLAKCEEELIYYKSRLVPKFDIKDTLYYKLSTTNEVLTISVDEIAITRLGVFYIEFINEKEMKQIPEIICFKTKEEAEKPKIEV